MYSFREACRKRGSVSDTVQFPRQRFSSCWCFLCAGNKWGGWLESGATVKLKMSAAKKYVCRPREFDMIICSRLLLRAKSPRANFFSHRLSKVIVIVWNLFPFFFFILSWNRTPNSKFTRDFNQFFSFVHFLSFSTVESGFIFWTNLIGWAQQFFASHFFYSVLWTHS